MMKKLMILLFVLWGLSISTAFAYPQDRKSDWGYQPLYTTQTNVTVSAPAYQFRTTSAYLAAGTNASDAWTTHKIGLRKTTTVGGSLDEEEDDPIGVVPNPLGTPLVLLLFAALYLLGRTVRTDGVLVGIYAILMKKRKKVKNYLHNS